MIETSREAGGERHEPVAPSAAGAAVAWYVIAAKLRREHFAAQQLGQRGIETYFPRLALVRRGVRLVRPLFPGYLFARLGLPADWKRVVWTPGVRRLVTFEGEASPVPDEALSFLRAQAGADGLIAARPRPLPPGHRVRVTDGPLAGLVGIIENPPDGRGRVSVLMDILRTQTRVSLDVRWLEEA